MRYVCSELFFPFSEIYEGDETSLGSYQFARHVLQPTLTGKWNADSEVVDSRLRYTACDISLVAT